MREIGLLNASKETDNKLRWQTKINGAQFELYIPKWRAPVPWPGSVIVQIENDFEKGKPWLDEMNQNATTDQDPKQPIIAVVERAREHTRTVRFTPEGSPDTWEIGEPYILFELLEDQKSLELIPYIRWDREPEWYPNM